MAANSCELFRFAESEPHLDSGEASSKHICLHNGLSCSPQLRSTQRRHRGRPQSRRQARTRNRVVTRVPAIACVRTSPPTRSNCPRWHASTHSSAGAGCSGALPSRCVLRSVTNFGPTLSRRTPTCASRTPLKCLPQVDSSLREHPARRCVPA